MLKTTFFNRNLTSFTLLLNKLDSKANHILNLIHNKKNSFKTDHFVEDLFKSFDFPKLRSSLKYSKFSMYIGCSFDSKDEKFTVNLLEPKILKSKNLVRLNPFKTLSSDKCEIDYGNQYFTFDTETNHFCPLNGDISFNQPLVDNCNSFVENFDLFFHKNCSNINSTNAENNLESFLQIKIASEFYKIYCYGSNITINQKTFQCPNYVIETSVNNSLTINNIEQSFTKNTLEAKVFFNFDVDKKLKDLIHHTTIHLPVNEEVDIAIRKAKESNALVNFFDKAKEDILKGCGEIGNALSNVSNTFYYSLMVVLSLVVLLILGIFVVIFYKFSNSKVLIIIMLIRMTTYSYQRLLNEFLGFYKFKGCEFDKASKKAYLNLIEPKVVENIKILKVDSFKYLDDRNCLISYNGSELYVSNNIKNTYCPLKSVNLFQLVSNNEPFVDNCDKENEKTNFYSKKLFFKLKKRRN